MITDLIKASWKPLILIALVSITITWAFNIQNTMIQTQVINGITIRTFNAYTYMQNLNNAWNSNALDFNRIVPHVQWQELNGNVITADFWRALMNNLIVAFNWTYFPINFILWIFRWICWLINILLTLIGWNTMKDINGDYYSQLAMVLNWIVDNLMIPYIQP